MLSKSNSPGGGINFERAPFKLTSEYLQVLGGDDSDMLQCVTPPLCDSKP
jgi:hypothetical protein